MISRTMIKSFWTISKNNQQFVFLKAILHYKTMDEVPRIHPNLSNKAQCRLNEINEIKDYFIAEIHKRETISKKLSK